MGFTPEEYEQLGRAWHYAVGTAVAMGHNSAAALADYVDPAHLTPLTALVHDSFTAARLDELGRDARARIVDFVRSTDTLDLIGAAVTEDGP